MLWDLIHLVYYDVFYVCKTFLEKVWRIPILVFQGTSTYPTFAYIFTGCSIAVIIKYVIGNMGVVVKKWEVRNIQFHISLCFWIGFSSCKNNKQMIFSQNLNILICSC